ncbi:hypothetical protein BH11BAC5_BH11BAC5_54740 [soil metagenome]
MKPVDQLIEYLKQDKVIPVIGAGFSYAVAKLPGWKGLIENGLAYADDRGLPIGTQSSDARKLLEEGKLIAGAGIMKQLLNSPGHPFTEWLEAVFGNPAVVSDDLIHSVNNLCTPFMLTTNYDDLLYSRSRLKTKKVLDWSEQQETARAIQKNTELILHIHGVYEKPETIILSEDDYTMLSGAAGYKANLQKLWTNYHFLFIGCSKDGVMDEDFSTIFKFLNAWFPSVPNEHFILFHQSEIDKGAHRELMYKCNVQPISYGTDYNALPTFINSINPNKDKLKLRLEAVQKEIQDAFERELKLPSGKFNGDPAVVNSFIKENLPGKNYWIDSVQLKILEDVLKEHNQQVSSKKEQFRTYQAIIKGLVSVNELDEKVALWQEHRFNPEALNNSSFINLAILAYECLNRMPADLMEDFRHRRMHAIHECFFDGYLGIFIEEAKDGRILYSDAYLFENLKRIISSLSSLLEADADEIFAELAPSTLTNQLAAPFLVFCSAERVSIRESEVPYAEIAALPADPALPFKGEVTIWKKADQYLVIAHNSQQCMHWNPVKDIAPVVFYTAPAGREIWSIIKTGESEKLELMIDLGYLLVKMVDFKIDSQSAIEVPLMNFIFSQHYKRLIGSKNLAVNTHDYSIYDVLENGVCVPLFTRLDLWNMVTTIPALEKEVKEELESFSYTHDKAAESCIRNLHLHIDKWGHKEIAVLDFELRMTKSHSVVIGFDISTPIPAPVFKVLLLNKACVAAGLINKGAITDLLCGYLGIGDYPVNMLEYITGLETSEITVADDSNVNLPKRDGVGSDIYAVHVLNSERSLVLQAGGIVHDVKLPEISYTSAQFDGLKKIVRVGFV